MRRMKRGCVSGGLALALAMMLASCFGGESTPGGEVTELFGLKLDESRMTAGVKGSQLALKMFLERTQNRAFEGRVKVALVDLDGKTYDQREAGFRLDAKEASFYFNLGGLPESPGLENLGKFLLGYRVEWDGHALFGSRSVFTAVEKLEAQVVGPSKLYEGEGTFVRVLARDPGSGRAVPGVGVDVELQIDDSSHALGSGSTDANGTAEVFIQVPEGLRGTGKMVVSMLSQEGNTEKVEGSVDVLREEKILLTTDKPLYQPGQVIHMRLLALRRPELRPVGDEELLFEVRDGKGNKVFKQQGRTNAFGIGAAEFRLASEVNMGDYEIRARVGTTDSLKTVEVKRYALPKFGATFRPDRGYYLPGERVTGQVSARYFFGKPVNGSVRVKVFTFDVGLSEIGEVEGTLNDEGVWGFAYDLPTAFAGIDLLQGDAYLQFDVEVTDLAEHTEKISAVSVVAASPLKVALVPESGDLVPGVKNILHVITADPTGMAVPAHVELSAEGLPPVSISTDARGLGRVALDPQEGTLKLTVSARDALGNQVVRDVLLEAGKSGAVVLLRVDRRLYKVGDTIQLSIFANDTQDRIYLDIIKGNQTLLTHTVDLQNGQAVYALDATPEMVGNIQFDAYYLTRESQIVRDSQLALVEGARDLALDVSLDKKTYLPAETATISFQVKDPSGAGVPAAVGLAVVDEAVFALSDFRPGLAETFFEIEREILKPRFQIINSSSLGDYLDSGLSDQEREASAEVVFAAARGFAGYGIEKNTYVDASKKVAALLKERVNQDTEKAIKNLRSLADRGLITAENLRRWLERNGKRWFDPFGQPYRVTVSGTNEWDQTLVFHSTGPDELSGSPDDLDSDGFFGWYIFSGRYGGFGRWGNEDMAEAGNNQPGGDPPHTNGNDPNPDDNGKDAAAKEQPRVRSYFPETLYVNPTLLTDEAGRATVEIPLADSITTWRMSSLASSLWGQIGSRSDGILVFQDFFIDVDFPATLTRGDQVSVPVAVYNYLDLPQSIRLELQQEPWFVLQDASSKTIDLGAGGVGVVYFTLTMNEVGWHGLTIFGYGSEKSDAVRRTVEVVPDGKEFRISLSDRLGEGARQTVRIPEEAIDGASRIFVKVYPGLMSQAVEGLDALLRIPNGCFEQTTTTAWPNIMVLNYLKKSGQLTPAIELKARDYVNQSYQRIVTFECPSGGFNWWVGDDPGNAILTAMALMMFADARETVDLDLDLVRRSEEDLVRDQQSDGCWSGESHLHAGNEVYGESGLRASAFCTWGLSMSKPDHPAVASGLSCLKAGLPGTTDLYTKALVACALAWTDRADPALSSLLGEIESLKQNGANGTVFWEGAMATASGACGRNGDIETTALITQALIKAGMYPDAVNGAISWLIQQKDSFGTWPGTQGTVQSLRAMTMAMDFAASQNVNGTVRVGINGVEDSCTFALTPENSDVTRICELNPYTLEGDNVVTIGLAGEGSFLYQAVGVYYLPWSMVSDSPDGPLSISVSYDRTQLAVDDTVTVNVTARYNVPGERASMIMLDLGIPPGFDLLTEDLTALVQKPGQITRFEIRGRQLSIYVDELAHDAPLSFRYRMKAKFPIHGQVPESSIWAYYNPELRGIAKPVLFEVVR